MVWILARQTIPLIVAALAMGWYFPALHLAVFSVLTLCLVYVDLRDAHPEIAGGVFYFALIKTSSFLGSMWITWLIRALA